MSTNPFDDFWDTTKAAATPETFHGWERSCRQAWDTATRAERQRCAALCATTVFSGNTFPVHQMEQLRIDIAAEILNGAMTTPARTEFEAAALPPLPKPWDLQHDDDGRPRVLFTADQTQAYARTAIAAAMGWPTVPEVKS